MKYQKTIFWILPIFVIGFMKAMSEVGVMLLPVRYAWILVFVCYYAVVVVLYLFFQRQGILSVPERKKIKWNTFLFGIVVPSFLPFWFFLNNYRSLEPVVFFYILCVALINPYFEELFWRRTLAGFSISATAKILYSAGMFGFMHYAVWSSYWFSDPKVWVSTVVATSVMGVCWMIFYLKTGNYTYIILSHVLVDIFNLSAAIYLGLPLRTI